jgi:hypothetical protein
MGLAACNAPGPGNADPGATPPFSGSDAPVGPKLVAAADARVLRPELREAALHADPELRARATRLLGQLEIEAARPLLELALADREPGIRLDAARGIARHPGFSNLEREQLLLGALAAAGDERAAHSDEAPRLDPSTIGIALLELLADTWPNASSPALAMSLQSREAEEVAGGCRALGRLAQRGHAAPVELIRAALQAVLESQRTAAATDCAQALREPLLAAKVRRDPTLAGELMDHARTALPDLAVPILDLVAQLGDPAALPALQTLLLDGSEKALAAARALTRLASLPQLLSITRQQLDHASAPGAKALPDDRLPVLLALFAALEPHVQQPAVAVLAERAVVRLARAEEPERQASARALAQCAAARLADLARRWPKHTLDCGAGIAPDSVRDTGIANVLGRIPDSPELRAAQLDKLFRKGVRAVQLEVIWASASLPAELASPVLVRALSSQDPPVLAAGLRALPPRAPDFRLRPELVTALTASATRAAEVPEAALSFIHAAQALLRPAPGAALDPSLRDQLTHLAEHPALGLREPARALLDEWQQPLPSGHRETLASIEPSKVPDPTKLFHVKLWTSAQTVIELELDPRQAPAAVVAFAQLVLDGALDGMPVASLAPGRLIAFRPHAAPGFALRHEDSAQPIDVGSVVLQDHGRDVVGPGFALILARTPELDRKLTTIGRFTNRQQVAALHVGDRIERAELVRPTP